MKILIITVAGMSTRFSNSVGHEVIKCIYNESDFTDSLIYRMISQPVKFDKYIIVGGYRYDELEAAINQNFSHLADKIVMVNNPYFKEYGSGYSLYCGLKQALEYGFDSIVFAEGDLYVDSQTYLTVCESNTNVVTCNTEPILANKAVAFYYNADNRIRYIYDTGHKALEINEPFMSIHNSGQIWKLSEPDRVREVYDAMPLSEWEGTNLVFIEKYFNHAASENVSVIRFNDWVNCNTVDDFRRIKE